MSSAPAVTAVIAAAGSGERLGAGGPKAFVPLAGRAMVEWSIDAFASCEAVAAIVVAVPPPGSSGSSGWSGSSSRLPDVRRAGPGDGSRSVVAGGATRAQSVANALAEVETEVVAIHDAARPLVTAELVEALVASLVANPEAAAVIPAAPITDTVKRARPADRSNVAFYLPEMQNATLEISETLDRAELWGAQTPQVFRTDALRAALVVDDATRDACTDEAMLVEQAGGTVLIHPSGPENLKVTTPLDLRIAELLLAGRDQAL
ncbi:MAG: 2-C-methyl-D-erythritol 4-phosphate cytidylyltransferase [Solirubrobacterales bacterium]